MTDSFIKVWRFHEAPEDLQWLSSHGGDEDWLAVVPEDIGYVPWLESGSSFGYCDISKHVHVDYPGYLIYIGAHA